MARPPHGVASQSLKVVRGRACGLATVVSFARLRGVGMERMYRLAWAAATLILVALAFAAGRMTLGLRIMPEIVATLPGDETEFSRELDARLRERFPIGSSQDKLIGYLVGANFVPDWPR